MGTRRYLHLTEDGRAFAYCPPAGETMACSLAGYPGKAERMWGQYTVASGPEPLDNRPRMASANGDPQPTRFRDRRDAGRRLADRLLPLAAEDPVVVGLPRGGVPVAGEVAAALHAPLEILAVRKLGAPHNPEYGIGAIAEDGTRVFDAEALAVLGISGGVLDSIVDRETAELRRRVAAYRGDREAMELRSRVVVVVDDGVATGVTDTAALRAIRRRGPRRLVLAVPVCAPDSAARLRGEADEVVCLAEPPQLYGVGEWYRDFSQVSDQDVISVLGPPRNAAA